MIHDPECIDDCRESMIDALLQAAYDHDAESTKRRVASVLSQLETVQAHCVTELSRPAPLSRRRWISLAVAASLVGLLIVGFQILSPSQSAMAAIERSLVAAAEDIARRYLITVTFRNVTGESQTAECDLYVQGNDRFALRHPALMPGSDLWLGQQDAEAWVVPAFGPVRTGDDTALARWLDSFQKLPTPYLDISTVLERMSRGYQLNELGNETIHLANGNHVACRHVVGRLRANFRGRFKLPSTIELWADAQSGAAQRIEAVWEIKAGEAGRERVVIEYVSQPDLPADWFTAAGHFSPPRRVLHFDSTE